MYKIQKYFVPPPGCTPKIIRVMKLITLMIITAILQVSANTYAQKVTLSEKNVPLTKIFNEIRQQSGYDFILTQSMLDKANPVTIKVNNAELKDVLDQIFRNQPLEYELKDKSVLIKEKTASLLDKAKTYFVTIDVHGTVVDESGLPLPGATAQVKGGNNSTTTDAKGNFTLTKVDPGTTLIISYIGYDKKEISASENVGIIKLIPATNPLDEVKVIAYGQTTDRLSVGNVSSVGAKTIERQPVGNILQALEGQVPGLFITQANGIAGGAVNVRIQGQNSIGHGNDPLYIIDGIPYNSTTLATSNAPGPLGYAGYNGGSGNSLSFIDPNEIESISILKDADATAIYGSRAANGAVVITTKKGKAGDMTVNFNVRQGWGEVARMAKLLNTSQYLEMRHEALKNDGLNPYPSIISNPGDNNYDINGQWDTTRYTNWQKTLIGNTASYSDYNANISGGSEKLQYFIGSTYNRESSVFPGDFSNQRASVHFSVNGSSKDERFHFSFAGSYLNGNNHLPSGDLTPVSLTLAPDAPLLFNNNGGINWAPKENGATSFLNPIATYTYNTYQNQTNNITSNSVLSYNIVKGFDFKVNLGYNHSTTNEMTLGPLVSNYPENQAALGTLGRFGYYTNSISSSWTIEPQLNYQTTVDKGKLDALLGMSLYHVNNNGQSLLGSGYNSDLVLADIYSAASIEALSSLSSFYRYNALFGRLNYNWSDKYLIDITARRDGSSRFGANNQFHNFGAVGAAWIFTEESLIKRNLDFISFGKLKVSYGITGNDQIGDYQYLNLYLPFSVGVPYQGISATIPNGLPNPNLQWEVTKKMNFGIDLGFLKDKINIQLNYALNRSSNELLSLPLSSATGFTFITGNLPATVQNKSWEIVFQTQQIKSADFSWTSNFNLTIPHNKLVSYPGLSANSPFVVGQPLGVTKAFEFIGVDSQTGQYQFKDNQGNVTNNPNPVTDMTFFVNTAFPKLYGGLQNSFRYKNWQLDVFLQFARQIKQSFYFGNPLGWAGYRNYNQPVTVLARWEKPGDITNIQQYTSGFNLVTQFNDAVNSDRSYSDASYIRLKNVALSYNLPKAWTQKVHIRTCQLFLQGQNLMTFTHFQGLDPETGNGALPPLRILALGLRTSL